MRDWGSSITHIVGGGLSVLLGAWVLWSRIPQLDWVGICALSIFVGAIICVFTMSALYHAFSHGSVVRSVFERLDHAFIFVAIASTYSAIIAVYLQFAWWLALALWIAAAIGILAASLGAKYKVLRTIFCIVMGWSIVLVWNQVVQSLPQAQLLMLIAGGACYTIGSIFFLFDSVQWPHRNFGFHEVWHVFVIAGALCHLLLFVI